MINFKATAISFFILSLIFISIFCLLNDTINTCEQTYTETGILYKANTTNNYFGSDIKINGFEYSIENIHNFDLTNYYNKCCKVVFMSGCGQTHIISIEIVCTCECE